MTQGADWHAAFVGTLASYFPIIWYDSQSPEWVTLFCQSFLILFKELSGSQDNTEKFNLTLVTSVSVTVPSGGGGAI